MPPQQTPNQNSNGNTPQQPQPNPATEPGTPLQYNSQPQPVSPMPTPLAGQATQNSSGIPLDNIDKEKKQALWFAIGSLAVFVIGFIVGYAALLGALLGGYAIRKAKPINYNLGFVLGIIGVILNAGFYLLAVLVK